jgi:hypothetical protein
MTKSTLRLPGDVRRTYTRLLICLGAHGCGALRFPLSAASNVSKPSNGRRTDVTRTRPAQARVYRRGKEMAVRNGDIIGSCWCGADRWLTQ